jgi:hypothetical protein
MANGTRSRRWRGVSHGSTWRWHRPARRTTPRSFPAHSTTSPSNRPARRLLLVARGAWRGRDSHRLDQENGPSALRPVVMATPSGHGPASTAAIVARACAEPAADQPWSGIILTSFAACERHGHGQRQVRCKPRQPATLLLELRGREARRGRRNAISDPSRKIVLSVPPVPAGETGNAAQCGNCAPMSRRARPPPISGSSACSFIAGGSGHPD